MLEETNSRKNGEIITTTGDSNGVVNGKTGNLDSGVKRMNSTIENGKPVEVGVDWKAKQTDNFKKNGGDGMTDHFIVIMGKTETLNNGAVHRYLLMEFQNIIHCQLQMDI